MSTKVNMPLYSLPLSQLKPFSKEISPNECNKNKGRTPQRPDSVRGSVPASHQEEDRRCRAEPPKSILKNRLALELGAATAWFKRSVGAAAGWSGATRLFHKVLTVDSERKRIARDLHDTLGANLTQIILLVNIVHLRQTSREEATAQLSAAGLAAREALATLDEIVWALKPDNDNLGNSIEFLTGYAVDFFRAVEIRCLVSVPNYTPAASLSGNARRELFLAFKECIHNIVQHADASIVLFHVRIVGSYIILSIADDGKGFNYDGPRSGDGLANMQHRLSRIRGECKVDTSEGMGTAITFSIPFCLESRKGTPELTKAFSEIA